VHTGKGHRSEAINSPAEVQPVTITVGGDPVASGRPRITRKGFAYTPAATRKYEAQGAACRPGRNARSAPNCDTPSRPGVDRITDPGIMVTDANGGRTNRGRERKGDDKPHCAGPAARSGDAAPAKRTDFFDDEIAF
jgi:hypothetical protein